MNVLPLDTNVASILFNRNHRLRQACVDIVAGKQLVISFMTRAELLLWPTANNWGDSRRAALDTCAIWAEIVGQSRRAGRPVQTADAWISSAARQWSCPLVTTDFRDYDAIEDLEVIPVH
jgi:predicted nucleic acid-binding protein